MSGPIEERDIDVVEEHDRKVDAREGRKATVGGLDIVRVLPTKGRRTVGAWCFVDLMAPDDLMEPPPMEVGPHPHIGLATVTWLLSGEALHSDSLGTEQVIRPGQLNLMNAGHGIAHAELGITGGRGVQMWVAQPEETRHGASSFEHFDELPLWQFTTGEAAVFIGTLADVTSPATAATPIVGAEFRMGPGTVEVPADRDFEYALVPLDSPMRIEDHVVEPGWIGLVEPGPTALRIDAGDGGGRAMLLGGTPLGEPIQMWWNFVARTKDEITDAWRAWQDHDTDRFATVPSKLDRIDAPRPPWLRSEG
jgi:quercetin 2,3-dioxygenase